ncbi:hypothetical protein IEE83_02525 [Dyadobacter sp. UP-52]|uniref:Uncharacterized protein n=1 Tax=Dyadobacter subterraneus TaxID=2773304 RepID=A0ABR9W5L2_9BACT|nr:hypothetical protein [Dyadobacter subterraneus]
MLVEAAALADNKVCVLKERNDLTAIFGKGKTQNGFRVPGNRFFNFG